MPGKDNNIDMSEAQARNLSMMTGEEIVEYYQKWGCLIDLEGQIHVIENMHIQVLPRSMTLIAEVFTGEGKYTLRRNYTPGKAPFKEHSAAADEIERLQKYLVDNYPAHILCNGRTEETQEPPREIGVFDLRGAVDVAIRLLNRFKFSEVGLDMKFDGESIGKAIENLLRRDGREA